MCTSHLSSIEQVSEYCKLQVMDLTPNVVRLHKALQNSKAETHYVRSQLASLKRLVRKAWWGDGVAAAHVGRIIGNCAAPTNVTVEEDESKRKYLCVLIQPKVLHNWASLTTQALRKEDSKVQDLVQHLSTLKLEERHGPYALNLRKDSSRVHARTPHKNCVRWKSQMLSDVPKTTEVRKQRSTYKTDVMAPKINGSNHAVYLQIKQNHPVVKSKSSALHEIHGKRQKDFSMQMNDKSSNTVLHTREKRKSTSLKVKKTNIDFQVEEGVNKKNKTNLKADKYFELKENAKEIYESEDDEHYRKVIFLHRMPSTPDN
ncbi:uncharacterized protein [Lepisosteus oculatus]|uniref:uncharacterized protein isoform X3 n=1 Tax=Lepisosteus oculatus TaxID=7918 RepID=UPI0035F4FF4E